MPTSAEVEQRTARADEALDNRRPPRRCWWRSSSSARPIPASWNGDPRKASRSFRRQDRQHLWVGRRTPLRRRHMPDTASHLRRISPQGAVHPDTEGLIGRMVRPGPSRTSPTPSTTRLYESQRPVPCRLGRCSRRAARSSRHDHGLSPEVPGPSPTNRIRAMVTQLRFASRDRDRKCATVAGVAPAHRRPCRIARATDRDIGRAASDIELARRSRAGVSDRAAERHAAVRG